MKKGFFFILVLSIVATTLMAMECEENQKNTLEQWVQDVKKHSLADEVEKHLIHLFFHVGVLSESIETHNVDQAYGAFKGVNALRNERSTFEKDNNTLYQLLTQLYTHHLTLSEVVPGDNHEGSALSKEQTAQLFEITWNHNTIDLKDKNELNLRTIVNVGAHLKGCQKEVWIQQVIDNLQQQRSTSRSVCIIN
jgi:hypothetical protein